MKLSLVTISEWRLSVIAPETPMANSRTITEELPAHRGKHFPEAVSAGIVRGSKDGKDGLASANICGGRV